MSPTLLVSGLITSSSASNLSLLSPDRSVLPPPFSPSPKRIPSPWTSPSSSMMETAPSFTARKSAASNLPTFQLPPPDNLAALHSRFPTYPQASTTQPTPAVASHVLTPPVGVSNDGLSPLASSVNSNASSTSSNGGPSYQGSAMGYWPTPQNPSNYSSAPSLPANFAQGPGYMGRSLYSPSMNFPNRYTHSPGSGEGLPPPPYDLSLPPFATPMSSSGGAQQQQHQMNSNGLMNAQQQPSSQAPSQGSLHASDNYGGRPPPSPAYYTPTSTSQQAAFPAYAQQSPTQHSPQTSQPPQDRLSPVQAHSMAAPQGYHPRPYGGYNLPAMAGPIMSNVHSPGNQMALVGGSMQMQYQPHQMGGQMYGHHPGQQQQPSDRPFKCDQCPQSFNRNHDLKRHKRIHLAVKPFPCGHCDKSFSRKDALKRHILVKGCGKSPTNANRGSQSPLDRSAFDKSEVMSDSTGGSSPDMTKREM